LKEEIVSVLKDTLLDRSCQVIVLEYLYPEFCYMGKKAFTREKFAVPKVDIVDAYGVSNEDND